MQVFLLRFTIIPTSGSRAWFTVARCNRRKRELENEIEEKVERRRDRKVREQRRRHGGQSDTYYPVVNNRQLLQLAVKDGISTTVKETVNRSQD